MIFSNNFVLFVIVRFIFTMYYIIFTIYISHVILIVYFPFIIASNVYTQEMVNKRAAIAKINLF